MRPFDELSVSSGQQRSARSERVPDWAFRSQDGTRCIFHTKRGLGRVESLAWKPMLTAFGGRDWRPPSVPAPAAVRCSFGSTVSLVASVPRCPRSSDAILMSTENATVRKRSVSGYARTPQTQRWPAHPLLEGGTRWREIYFWARAQASSTCKRDGPSAVDSAGAPSKRNAARAKVLACGACATFGESAWFPTIFGSGALPTAVAPPPRRCTFAALRRAQFFARPKRGPVDTVRRSLPKARPCWAAGQSGNTKPAPRSGRTAGHSSTSHGASLALVAGCVTCARFGGSALHGCVLIPSRDYGRRCRHPRVVEFHEGSP